jgi:hypothetical protein
MELGGSPINQAISHAVRVRNVLLKCPVFNTEERASNPFVKAILVFSHKNSKLKIDPDKLPKNCKILKVNSKTDKSIADYILKESYKFSNGEVKEIEEYFKTKIRNFETKSKAEPQPDITV